MRESKLAIRYGIIQWMIWAILKHSETMKAADIAERVKVIASKGASLPVLRLYRLQMQEADSTCRHRGGTWKNPGIVDQVTEETALLPYLP